MFLSNDRQRGQMPVRLLRLERSGTNTIKQQERTGEPFPSWHYPPGHGKAHGSFTEKMRLALYNYRKEHGLILTFRYKLSRKRIIEVVADSLYIGHDPQIGSGLRGFTLKAHVLTIDNVKPHQAIQLFYLSRLVMNVEVREMLALTEGSI